jgi:multicomponent Na+:H+ antiporter subunit C
MSVYPYLVAVWLLVVGLWGVVRSRNYIHLIICLMVVQASTYVLLLSVGYLKHGRAPIFTSDIPSNSRVVDPVVQALTLTDVVVEATVVALLLALVVQANKRYGTVDPDEIVQMRE